MSAAKAKLLLLFGLSLCCMGQQSAMGQSVPAPNTDPDRLRAIVQAAAQKAGTKGSYLDCGLATARC
jgi:hypothetical protein